MKDFFSQIPTLRSERVVLRRLEEADAPALQKLADSAKVNRYLPTFLFEKKYPDAAEAIRRMYDECLEESLILGIFLDGEFCGLAEMYGYRPELRKISLGCRLAEGCWGQGVAAEATGLMVQYLTEEAGIGIITASSMVENTAAAETLRRQGFELVVSGAEEDWGFEEPVLVNKWIR